MLKYLSEGTHNYCEKLVGNNMNYYQMTYVEEEEYAPFGVAYAPPTVDVFVLPSSGTRVQSWEPLRMQLRDGGFADYLANDLGVRLCSLRMKDVIDTHASKDDQLQWLEAEIIAPNGELRPYYILHFPTDMPIVNQEKSIMAGDFVVKAVFNKHVVQGHEVFGLPKGGQRTYVSETMRQAIKSTGLNGMAFGKVRVA